MASVAERTRARRARTAARTETAITLKRADAAGVIVGSAPRELEARAPYVRKVSGLEFLRGRDKITADQFAAGERYARCFRQLELAAASIKSGLAEPERVGGSSAKMRPPELDNHAAFLAAAARAEIHGVRIEALRNHVGLTAVVDVICGKGWTLGEISKVQREQEEALCALRIALDYLVEHYAGLDRLKATLA